MAVMLYRVPCWCVVLINFDEVRHKWLSAESIYRLDNSKVLFGWSLS